MLHLTTAVYAQCLVFTDKMKKVNDIVIRLGLFKIKLSSISTSCLCIVLKV